MTDCSKCKGKIQIKRSYNKIVNDNTPDMETELYTVLERACMNDKCSEYGVVVETIEHKQEIG